jgi:D-alanyl-D-alanine-carboxypeptidase/D-alanyl-D-alanine-endopeptidase
VPFQAAGLGAARHVPQPDRAVFRGGGEAAVGQAAQRGDPKEAPIETSGLGATRHVPQQNRAVRRARGEAPIGQHAQRGELPRDPGASYEYSNLGFGLLGYALVRLQHNTSYGALTDGEILKPLGMTMSGTAFTSAMRSHLAPGHDAAGKAADNWDLDALAGAGAIRSTANDMLRYLKANMGIDRSPLAAAMKFAQRPRRHMAKTMRIGLAWVVTDKGIVWHNGETGGYRSFLGFTADGLRGVVILANTAVDADDLGFATLEADAPLVPESA